MNIFPYNKTNSLVANAYQEKPSKKKNSGLRKPQNSFFVDLKQAFFGIPKEYKIVYGRKYIIFSIPEIQEVKINPTTRQKILGLVINRYSATATAIAVLAIASYIIYEARSEISFLKIEVRDCQDMRKREIRNSSLSLRECWARLAKSLPA